MIPRLHVVTDDRVLARPDFEAVAHEVLRAGGSRVALHVRGPRTPGRAVYEAAVALKLPARRAGAWLVVNDRVDVALALGTRRVHLGARSIPASVARRLLGRDARVGRSVHSAREVGGEGGEIDYLFAGTVFATPSHSEAVPGGVRTLRAITAIASVPVVAIGGVIPERVGRVIRAGARGVAAIRAVWDAPSPGDGVQRFLDVLPEE